MSLDSYRRALLMIEGGLDYETALMATMMLAREDDGAALAGFYPLTADELSQRIEATGGRLAGDPPEDDTVEE